MTRHRITIVLATIALALVLAGAVPRQAAAVSFVDKQVQAGALLIQKYIDDYGQAKRYVYPPVTMVKKGGGLPGATLIWPSNPWTGRIMAPGTAKGTYTYRLLSGGSGYRLIVHLSRSNWKLTGGVPAWFRPERNTACQQNLLLLQRYVETYKVVHGGYPAATDVNPTIFAAPAYVWPVNPWTGMAMAQTAPAALGDFSYTQLSGGAGYSLKVMLTTGWSSPALTPISLSAGLSVTPGG